MRTVLTVFAALLTSLPTAVGAQRLRSVEANVGVSGGRGRDFGDRGGLAADALVSFGLRPLGQGTLVGAVNATASATMISDVCYPHPDGGCKPSFPSLAPLAVLMGWEHSSRLARVSAGPALVLTDDDYVKGSTGGLLGRLDLSTPAPFHIALVASVRGLLVPAFQGRPVSQVTVGVGAAIR